MYKEPVPNCVEFKIALTLCSRYSNGDSGSVNVVIITILNQINR